MEGRFRIVCAECGKTREVSGEMPREYIDCFAQIVREDGFAPRPGNALAFICGACARMYEGHETRIDAEKVRGERGPKDL
jgi:hypothetical protein